MKKKLKETAMYTIYYYPTQETFVQNNLQFLQTQNAQWVDDHYALVQSLDEGEVDQCYDACQSELIAGIKPGDHPQGSPTGCQK